MGRAPSVATTSPRAPSALPRPRRSGSRSTSEGESRRCGRKGKSADRNHALLACLRLQRPARRPTFGESGESFERIEWSLSGRCEIQQQPRMTASDQRQKATSANHSVYSSRSHNPQAGARPTRFSLVNAPFRAIWAARPDRCRPWSGGHFSPVPIRGHQRILGSAATTSNLEPGRGGAARYRGKVAQTGCPGVEGMETDGPADFASASDSGPGETSPPRGS